MDKKDTKTSMGHEILLFKFQIIIGKSFDLKTNPLYGP